MSFYKELDNATREQVLKHAVENINDFMRCMERDGMIADISEALAEVSSDYVPHGVTRNDIYEVWRKSQGY